MPKAGQNSTFPFEGEEKSVIRYHIRYCLWRCQLVGEALGLLAYPFTYRVLGGESPFFFSGNSPLFDTEVFFVYNVYRKAKELLAFRLLHKHVSKGVYVHRHKNKRNLIQWGIKGLRFWTLAFLLESLKTGAA